MSENDASIFDHRSDTTDVSGADVPHKNPYDRSGVTVWFFEDPKRDGNVLSQDGITQIAHHKYKAGHYTYLDEFLNPFWTFCTEIFLPMSMAPNMVTTLGGFCCFLSYMATWYYLPQFEIVVADNEDDGGEKDWRVPALLLIGNGLTSILYYTLDCMDGKQARRTGTSSPLGQLFDHGIDCCSNLTAVSTIQSFLLMSKVDYLWFQIMLQFVFFTTQWEEYFTGTLFHAHGKWLGVTEVSRLLYEYNNYFSDDCTGEPGWV
jgi:ethanolaminephosphotransferase